MLTIDKLCYNSKLRYVNAGEKFAFAVITLLFCVISRSMAVAVVVLAATGILTVYKGGIPLLCYLRYLSAPFAFLILSTFAIILNVSHTPMDLFAFSIGNYYLTGSIHSCRYAAQLILTALSAVSCLYFLSFNTPMPDILEVLSKLRFPKTIIELMLLIYRYIFILLSTAAAITTSQNSRLGNRNYKTSCKSFASMLAVLFIRSIKRSSTLYDAMEARCYDGSIHVLNESHPSKPKHFVYIILFECILFCIYFLFKEAGL